MDPLVTITFSGQTSLITGASSGLGLEFARTLAARGSNLVLVARREAVLDQEAEALRAAHGVTVTTIAADLARPAAATELHAELSTRGLTIQTLINNAGFGTYCPFINEDPARIAAEIQLNVGTLVALTHALLPELTSAGRGALVNVASTAAFQPVPTMAVYSATKAFVLNFTEAIAHEVRDTGLRVLALCPGATRTEFFDVVGTEQAAVGGFQTSQQVITTAMRALDRKRTPAYIVSGAANKASTLAVSALPRSLAVAAASRAVG